MKRGVFRLSLIVSSVLAGNSTYAEFTIGGLNVGFQPRLNGGGMYYEFSQPGADALAQAQQAEFAEATQNAINDILRQQNVQGSVAEPVIESVAIEEPFEVSALLPTIGGGGTLFVDRFFIDGYAQHAFQTSDSVSQSQDVSLSAFGTGTLQNQPLTFNATQIERQSRTFDVDIDRTEWSVSAGYAVTDSFSVYAGYKRAETTFEQNLAEGNIIRDITIAFTAQPATASGQAIRQEGTISQNVERDFEHDGPFVGAVYGWPINQWVFDGLLTFNLAVAFLDGEVTERATDTIITFEGAQQPEQVPDIESVLEGDSIGLSLGLSWKGSTPVEGLAYLIGVNGYQYDFDGDTVRLSTEPVDRNVDVDFDETVINFQAGLSYNF